MTSGAFRAPLESVEDPASAGEFWVFFGGRELPLTMTETLIGRGEGCHIVVNEPLVSRRHARLVLEDGRVFIEDLGSANGTFVNQARLHGRALLFPGDHVFIGTCEIELVQRGEAEERPTIPALDLEDRHTPESGVAAFEPV